MAYFPFLVSLRLLFILEGISRKQEAVHQAAEAPHIDAVRVGLAKDDLRCDGALSSDPPSERVRGRSKLRGATKVRNTGLSLGALIRHQNVPQFDVAMNNSEAV